MIHTVSNLKCTCQAFSSCLLALLTTCQTTCPQNNTVNCQKQQTCSCSCAISSMTYNGFTTCQLSVSSYKKLVGRSHRSAANIAGWILPRIDSFSLMLLLMDTKPIPRAVTHLRNMLYLFHLLPPSKKALPLGTRYPDQPHRILRRSQSRQPLAPAWCKISLVVRKQNVTSMEHGRSMEVANYLQEHDLFDFVCKLPLFSSQASHLSISMCPSHTHVPWVQWILYILWGLFFLVTSCKSLTNPS